MEAYVLVDYDNMIDVFQQMSLSALALRIEATADHHVTSLNDIFIRLYGGWYGPSGLTNRGTRLAQEINAVFPISRIRPGAPMRRVHCEIASSLIASKGFVLPHTFRERRGIRSRVKFQPNRNCSQAPGCTAAHVARWSKGKCPQSGCQVMAADVFTYHEQKLVDTLLCCDLIALASQTPPVTTFVISEDDDMIPAFLMAGLASKNVWQLQMKPLATRHYAMAMQQHNVQTAAL